MSEQTAVEGTQVERLQQSLKWFVAERDYFEGVSNQHYDKWQEAEKKIERLQQQNKQLIEENERLQKVEADYKALQEIMDRARRLAFIEEEEEEKPMFKVDADGNLTRL